MPQLRTIGEKRERTCRKKKRRGAKSSERTAGDEMIKQEEGKEQRREARPWKVVQVQAGAPRTAHRAAPLLVMR